MTRVINTLRTLVRQAISELRRLNSAGIGSEELQRLTPRERVRMVKAALEEGHDDQSRCC